jgi:hypothetical protein
MFTSAELERLTALLKEKVNLTLAEIRERFQKSCSLTAIHKIVRKLRFVYKNFAGKRTGTWGHSP